MISPSPEQLRQLQRRATAEGKICAVGALVKDVQGRVFVQKRASHRSLFPGCWDIVGGHVEAGETLSQALTREVREETGWELTRVVALLSSTDWEAQGIQRREFDFLVEVHGDLGQPVLEQAKVSEHRWLGPGQLDILKENRLVDDLTIFYLVQKVLASR